jgi:hypothetical protein
MRSPATCGNGNDHGDGRARSTGRSGTIVLASKYGPLLPLFGASRSATRSAGA